MFRFFTDLKAMLVENWQNVDEMLQNHWKEVALDQELMKLDPDYERYRKLVEQNALVVITAREDDKMIGYAIYFLARHLHYKTLLMALEDIHYIDPTHRNQGVGSAMLAKGEEVLKGLGVCYVHLRKKAKSEETNLYADLGYSPIETVWGKRLT